MYSSSIIATLATKLPCILTWKNILTSNSLYSLRLFAKNEVMLIFDHFVHPHFGAHLARTD